MRIAKVAINVTGCIDCMFHVEEFTEAEGIDIHSCMLTDMYDPKNIDICQYNVRSITPSCPLYQSTKFRSFLSAYKEAINVSELLYSFARMSQLPM